MKFVQPAKAPKQAKKNEKVEKKVEQKPEAKKQDKPKQEKPKKEKAPKQAAAPVKGYIVLKILNNTLIGSYRLVETYVFHQNSKQLQKPTEIILPLPKAADDKPVDVSRLSMKVGKIIECVKHPGMYGS